MLNQIGMPTVLLTLSAADLWWPDLLRLMGCDIAEEESLTEAQIFERHQKLINDNPLIVEKYFSYRANLFITEILCKTTGIDLDSNIEDLPIYMDFYGYQVHQILKRLTPLLHKKF